MKRFILIAGLFLLCLFMVVGCDQKGAHDEMKSQVEKLVAFWNTGDFEGIESVLCEDFEMRVSPHFEAEKGIDLFKESVLNARKSYPDFKIVIEESFFTEDACAGRWSIHATSQTGKLLNIPGMSIFHFEDGKIRDEWISNNDLLWLNQLDYTIQPPQAESEWN
jgi:predicted ester cyclase